MHDRLSVSSVLMSLALLAGLSACATPPMADSRSSTPASTDAPAAVSVRQVVTFVDLDVFDDQMKRALSGKSTEVAIEFPAPMSPNAISPRLGRWLNTLQEQGGQLQITGEGRTRSLSIIATLAQAIYAGWQEMRMRSLVAGMDAEMAIQGGSIQSLTLKRRP
ncbi:hypothetical protein [Inhella sp.]|uniref:hypothetical protein n=1 Tax=Inhella sp. TaxID=1921806 RepID=UPI0035B3E187